MPSALAADALDDLDDQPCADDGRGPGSARWVAAAAVLVGAITELLRTFLG